MNIIVDAMGGDFAPLEIVKGCALATSELGVEVTLVGKEKTINECIKENNIDIKNYSVIDCDDVITMQEHPDSILKEHKDCSMAAGLKLLNEGKGDAFISAGNTGALVVGATLFVKRIKGVKRAALAPLLPTNTDKDILLLDSGANVECSAEMLKQFAVLGNEYVKGVLNIVQPRIGLLNVGTEDSKGGSVQKEAFGLLKELDINFIGNIEARDVLPGVCDVCVADGFSGNIFLKASEGACMVMLKNIKRILKRNIISKLAALPLMGGLKQFAKKMDYTERGGAPLLGISKPVIKAHGNSNAKSFYGAIKQAVNFAQSNTIENITNFLKG
ncbi:MAG: phosphate acyltransferase PlsX [Acutalibacteraceae bacterium]|nr:phosphate acyltransferase PlsX [Acutalibacteraceae bacterium]